MCVCVLVLLCVFLPTEYKNLHLSSKVRIFLGSVDVLAAPHNFEGLFEGQDLVLGLRLDLGLGQGQGVRWDGEG